MKTVWSWWRGTGTLFEVQHFFFCYMAYNTKKNNTNYTVLLYCNQWEKNPAKKADSKDIPPEGWNEIFFSLYHPFNQFYFLKDIISKSVYLCKSDRFWRIITFWQEKSFLWPALWVIFTPVMSIMLTVVFTLS